MQFAKIVEQIVEKLDEAKIKNDCMGLLNLLFGDSPASSGNSPKTYQVRLKGTVYISAGARLFDRIVDMDETQKQLFTGGRRKETMEGWLKANYGQSAKAGSFTVQVL
ncbi:hypothetical protein AGMMS49965_26350 [Bacteroidia bacterium]|nr:hypothetical protein AGMMS49965_26350 [Bacteroidia bacterium]